MGYDTMSLGLKRVLSGLQMNHLGEVVKIAHSRLISKSHKKWRSPPLG